MASARSSAFVGVAVFPLCGEDRAARADHARRAAAIAGRIQEARRLVARRERALMLAQFFERHALAPARPREHQIHAACLGVLDGSVRRGLRAMKIRQLIGRLRFEQIDPWIAARRIGARAQRSHRRQRVARAIAVDLRARQVQVHPRDRRRRGRDRWRSPDPTAAPLRDSGPPPPCDRGATFRSRDRTRAAPRRRRADRSRARSRPRRAPRG